ncbi:MAG: tetratricopeptide repeat protein [Bacteroidales bacterium]|nr:tetratricopeptide repeat protein [Bacteroidales bacterium]
MNYTQVMEKYHLFFEYIFQKQLKAAFDILGEMAENCQKTDLKVQLEHNYETYINILKYSFELGDDPEKEKVYNKLVKSLTELVDDIREDLFTGNNLLSYYNTKRKLLAEKQITKSDSVEMVERLEFEKEINQIINDHKDSNKAGKNDTDDYKNHLNRIFDLVWLTDKFGDATIDLVIKIIKTRSVPWYDKSILVSALTLSLIRHFDSNKVMLLLDFYDEGEDMVWQRALVGWLLGLHFHDKRLQFYPEITDRLKSMEGDKSLTGNIELVILHFIKSKETEKISKKIKDEILPEVLKIKSRLEEKLDIENTTSFNLSDEKNPEWENFFKDSPDVYKKFEEFSNMQLDGADVFLGAFAMLKQFEFFNEFSNWFLPFYKENKMVLDSLGNIQEKLDTRQFAEGLENTSFMCNSDKYSFCLNVKHLPLVQKSMMTELFNMELKAMNELKNDDELVNATAHNKAIITQYFQDLYRFYKLHPLRHEFDDIFNLHFNIYQSDFFRLLIGDSKILRNIGEFFFEKNYFAEALDLFLGCLSSKQDTYELFEKIGFCYQQTANLNKAIEYYHKAEFLEKNRLWLYNKIAFCYRKLKNYNKAVEYYLEAEKLKPEDMQVQAFLGQTYMELGEYDNALKYYFKVEYHSPNDPRPQKPISWCYFVTGNLKNANKYLKKAISKDVNKNDYLNLGHIEWCLGNKKEAIANYRMAIKKSEFDYKWFTKIFQEDSKHLLKNGINVFDIPLMLDYLKISELS